MAGVEEFYETEIRISKTKDALSRRIVSALPEHLKFCYLDSPQRVSAEAFRAAPISHLALEAMTWWDRQLCDAGREVHNANWNLEAARIGREIQASREKALAENPKLKFVPLEDTNPKGIDLAACVDEAHRKLRDQRRLAAATNLVVTKTLGL